MIQAFGMNLLEIVLTLHDGLVPSWLPVERGQVILRPLTAISTINPFTSALCGIGVLSCSE